MENILLGAICGDVIGSIYEFGKTKDYNFQLFDDEMTYTDDTIMTIAVADWLLSSKQQSSKDLIKHLQRWGDLYKFPYGGYGANFARWLDSDLPYPYHSFGNGSAMRVSAVGWVCETLEETLNLAEVSASVTHNHIEGIKGAQATAGAIWMARNGYSKDDIKRFVEDVFRYNLSRTCEEIKPNYSFNVTCQGSVPESIIAFLESSDYEDAIRKAISMGGDADTMGAIAGSIAYAFYKKIPEEILAFVISKLPLDMKYVIQKFDEKYYFCKSK